LKVEAAKTPPPADIQARLAEGREVRSKARAAFTNATQTVKAKSSAVESAKAAVAELKKQDPQELIASAEARLAKLKSARAVGNLFRTRETVTARKRDHDKVQADIAAKKEELARLDKELATANSDTKPKLKAQIKTVSAELKTAEANEKKLASDLAAEEAKLKQLTAEAEKTRTVSTAAVQQSKL
jgi:chromosome segregation ATPase